MNENNIPDIFEEPDSTQQIKRIKRLERSGNDFVISGLCAGLGKYYNVDISFIRLISILSLALSSWFIYIYLLASFIFPLEKESTTLSDLEKFRIRRKNSYTVLSGALILAGILWLFKSTELIHRDNLLNQNSLLTNFMYLIIGIYLFDKNSSEEVTKDFEQVSKSKRIMFGVCKNLSDDTGIDINLIRAFFIIGTLITSGAILLLYIFLQIIQPRKSESGLTDENEL
ncbi:MAG: PspC domain-containing protein [Melioribacter sp.]|uniref:PspC domain-containing protein n=1 Tax=Rosettibacter primus TaxID=3111523 RepID=UPI00247C1EBD|nr:PspC domain-containing protein [Melioribacter sp.]